MRTMQKGRFVLQNRSGVVSGKEDSPSFQQLHGHLDLGELQMIWNGKKGNKFGNKKTELAGRTFDSKAEAALFLRLSLEEREGRIRDLSHHPGTVFLSGARIQYRPDFRYVVCETGETHWAEYKGFETPSWRKNLRLWRTLGPGPLHIWKGGSTALKLIETVIPKSDVCPTCGRSA